MNVIKCENPTFIVNPAFKDCVIKTKRYFTPTQEVHLSNIQAFSYSLSFPTYIFSAKKHSVSYSNCDSIYAVDTTGEIIPCWIPVPCGKCVICKDKSARHMMFRCECEASESSSETLFLTLTYDNDHLPDKGVFVRDVQLFLKRVRISLDRLGIEHNLRYYCVAEYGSNTHRAHYHLQLYNFPRYHVSLRTLPQVNDFLSDCWQKGFTYLLPAEKGCTAYITKYMRKPQDYIPKDKNKPFSLSSRKGGGIGSSWVKRNIDFYRKYLDYSQCTVQNGVNTFSSTLSNYAKSYIFPPVSRFLPSEIRQAFHDFRETLYMRVCVEKECFSTNLKYNDTIKKVLFKYRFLHARVSRDVVNSRLLSLKRTMFATACKLSDYLDKKLDYFCILLLSYEIDSSEILYIQSLKKRRAELQTMNYEAITLEQVAEIAYNLKHKISMEKYKEIL